MQNMFAYWMWSVDTLITSKANVFEDIWLSFQVRKTIKVMVLELHGKFELLTSPNIYTDKYTVSIAFV